MLSDSIVVNLNIFKQDSVRLFSGSKHSAVYDMSFQSIEEAFSHRIIPTFPLRDIL